MHHNMVRPKQGLFCPWHIYSKGVLTYFYHYPSPNSDRFLFEILRDSDSSSYKGKTSLIVQSKLALWKLPRVIAPKVLHGLNSGDGFCWESEDSLCDKHKLNPTHHDAYILWLVSTVPESWEQRQPQPGDGPVLLKPNILQVEQICSKEWG